MPRGEALNLTWDAIDETYGFASIEPRDGWTPKTAASHRRIPLSDGLTWACSRSRVNFRGSWSSPAVGSDPRSEPISMTRWMPHQIKLTYGRRLLRLHQHPRSAGGAQEARTILSIG